ncbi:tetratricopeptide repeat protein [Teredinibacter sp. KSP-S5-2]|uniref:tetratricopeptide repeat protein n=1 Tax=Teredinibacter sp. KSP-S5-2 TaxID=3034506 RepID=UPI002934DAF6|nr:tetratricopeptide repeat protein [Teredinibacter sp. KSP-S5-2]WNO08079.1 DUF3808 domain-containing protein [Teredinibacter sp. KSP-S5-2]
MNNQYRTIKNVTFVLTIALGLFACSSTPPKDKAPEKTDAPKQQITEIPTQTLSPLDKAQFEEAIESLNNNHLKIARKMLRKLNKDYPNHSLIVSNLATIEYLENDQDNALKLAQQALTLNPQNAHAHNIHGLILVNQDKIKEAELAYQNAIKYDDKYAEAYYNLALIQDTYYQDIALALKYYKAYLVLSGFKDEDTKSWIQQLEASLANKE